ncbi:MAG: PD-(D/E)XK nuclease family protein [Thermodesulfovibrionales bacterium]|nr:PD-(D/E)XK nuclease family protein [Thermodesulfovibrionales bacterium]
MSSRQPKQVKVFNVPFGRRGSAEELLKEAASRIKGSDYSKILYLSPTAGKTRESQRIFHKLTKNTYIPPEMTTIKHLSKKLYSLHGSKTPVSRTIIPIIISRLSGKGIGFSSIITSFIDELKQYFPLKDIETIRKELKNAFEELNVPEEGSKRALDAIEIFRRYQEILAAQNLIDENDLMAECPAIVKEHNYSHDILILDGFYEVTPSEELILKSLIEQAETTFISILYDENFTGITNSFDDFIKNNFSIEAGSFDADSAIPLSSSEKGLSYVSYPGIDEEVEGIARHIKNLFISGRCRSLDRIIVAFPKLHTYHNIVQRVFKRYGIPCAFSTSKPSGKTEPYLALTAMLESIADDYPRLQFSRFLTSPHFKKMPALFREWIPHISLYSGIIKGKNLWLGLSKTLSDVKNPALKGILPEIEKEFKWIFKKLKPLESLKDRGTFKQIAEALYKLLSELDFSGAEDADIKEQASEFLKELSLIDSLILTDAGSRNGLREFIDSLRYILNTSEKEAEGEGVQVSGFFELRCTEPEYLYLGGLKDGDLPSMPEIDLLLPDNVKTKLGLVNMKRYLHLQQFIFKRLTASSKNTCLSYPAMEADKLFLPSPFLPWKAETTEKTPGILCREEELLRHQEIPLSSHIKEISIKSRLIKKQFGENSNIRVTDIDSYRTCHRKFFIEKILRLEPSETKEYEIEAMLLGIIIHEIMEGLMAKPRSYRDFDEMKAEAEKLLTKLLAEKPLENYWKNFIRESFLSILPEIYELEAELSAEGYSFMKAEAPVEGEVIKNIKLKGKIDRIDMKTEQQSNRATEQQLKMKEHSTALLRYCATANNEVELIDYKTGAAQLNRTEILNKGASLQLFIYAALMKSLGFKVNRAGIYSVKDTKITWLPGKKDSMTMDDYIETCLKYLEKTVSDLRKGDFTAIPLNEQTCRNCHERAYCPYIQAPSG